MQIFNEPSLGFQVSMTELYLRFLFHKNHPIVKNLQYGAYSRYHKQAKVPHFELYGIMTLAHRNPTEQHLRDLELSNQVAYPKATAEDLVEIVFDRNRHSELRSCKPFHHTICHIDAQHNGSDLWLLPLPKHRRFR